MRRGRIFIYLALILIIGVAAAFFYLRSKGMLGTTPSATPTPEVRNVEVVTAGQNILPWNANNRRNVRLHDPA